MIQKDEIDAKSLEFQIHRANVERDYVFGWLLYGLFTISDLKETLFLKGGNALRKGYFENTRYSNDLDFGIPGDISQEVLLSEINKVCDFIQEKAEISFIRDDNKVEEKFSASEVPIPGLKVYEARVYFRDFYGNTDHFRIKISMDITRFDKVLLPIQSVKLIHPYSDFSELVVDIKCVKLEEIIATKLKCLLQRQHAPDLFDYAYSIKLLGGQLNKKEVVETLIKKTIFERNPQVLKNILLKTSFDYFREYWDKSLVCAKSIIFGVDDAINTLLADLESIFSIYTDSGYTDFAYFGEDLRMPIMKAARSQTLLRVRYKGEDRVIEPYSLKYLQKRDGQQREYFYAYNCSGGQHLPGIRCFVAENFQSIENTDDSFTPREGFLIELSKAGETPENPYLFDPNKPQFRPRTSFRRIGTRHSLGPKYVYQCSYCGKKFTRSSNNGILNAHKDKYGYPCGGRHGYYVNTRY
ncbi:nucleotidyl transferase AbiEii/AbiGii toxin family protein [Patescibacteria group bacterium]|nr:nucleotidyl transferase AbiEii/AbiGii toxin family protein [Patescibacteria group bacterium]